jgi:CO dehydrogenase nickel-insertion accessory protein CooC1
MHHIGTAKCWELIASARDDETIGIVISSEADARLIAEAPNMFALLKEYMKQHAFCAEEEPGEGCQCLDCEATRRLMQRVLGEA